MKSKVYLLGLACCFLITFNACKSKESAYKAAYEAAKEKEPQSVTEITPVVKNDSSIAQKEKVTVVDGSGIRKFNVVIGSFQNRTNAVSLKERMEKQGFKVILAQNEKNMYRVIVATFDDKSGAAYERDRIKNKYDPDFQDAWILEQQ